MKNLKKLYRFEWPGVHPHQLLPPARAWMKDFAELGSPFSFLAVTYELGTGSFWLIEEEYERQGRGFYERIEKDPQMLLRILLEVDKAADEIFRIGKVWNDKDLSKLSTPALLSFQKKLFKPAELLWRKGQPQNLLEMHNSFLSDKVKDIIVARFGLRRRPEVFTALTAGLYDSLLERQDRDFIDLAKRASSSPDDKLAYHPAVTAHFKKYAFMTYGWEGPAFSLDYFVDNLKATRKNKKVLPAILEKLSERGVLRKKQKAYLKQLVPKERKLVELLRALLDSKAKRVDAHSQTYFLGDKLFSELGRRRGLSLNQLRTLDPLDFPSRYRKATADELNDDYMLAVYWWEKGRVQKKYNGRKAKALIAGLESGLPKVKKVKELIGDLAYPGKVRGRVRIVLYAQNFNDFKDGDILITKMTDPSYIQLMKRSGAVVTDIGGITCHAAIVARELRKPCLIGTKVATKVFKDGDMVEVDANKGVVKKI